MHTDTSEGTEAATPAPRAWLVVASADHVARGVSLGIGQVNHGSRAGLQKMSKGDAIIYYSPTQVMNQKPPLQEFTAWGVIADDEIWQADEGDFKPFRRRVNFDQATPAKLADVRDQLILTQGPNWGYQLRRGLVELDPADARAIRASMGR